MEIVEATEAHAIALAPFLRDADREELTKATGRPIEEILIESVNSLGEHWAFIENGKTICLLGISEHSWMDSEGVIWLVASDEVASHRKDILAMSRNYIDEKQKHYRLLYNYIDIHNTSSIRWLKWLGFEVQDPVPWGVNGDLFHRFELRR
jgi:hypothetical protein